MAIDAADIAARIREEIRTETRLTASAGIADCKFVAKIASDFGKPDGLHEVPPGTSRDFLRPLPVSRLWGVGEKTEAVLKRHQLFTIGDVTAKSREWLIQELGSSGAHFWELGQGIDDRPVVPDRDAKSIGAQDTFEHDLHGVDALALDLGGKWGDDVADIEHRQFDGTQMSEAANSVVAWAWARGSTGGGRRKRRCCTRPSGEASPRCRNGYRPE